MHLEVLATDGTQIKRVLFIDQTSNGIYAGWIFKDRVTYLTYHNDGNRFITTKINNESEEIKEYLGKAQTLDNFRGLFQIADFSFASSISKLPYLPEYKLKRLDSILYIDTRSYAQGIGCSVLLLEPNKFDLINNIVFHKEEEFHIFTKFNPWILVSVRGI